MSLIQRFQIGLFPPKPNTYNSAFKSGSHKGLLRFITYGALGKGLSMLWERILVETTSWKSGRITLSRGHRCYRKGCETHEAWKMSSCWSKLCPDVAHEFTGFTRVNEGSQRSSYGYGNKVSERGFKTWILEKWWAKRHHSRGINRRQLDEDECLWTSARWWEEHVGEGSAREQIHHIKQSGIRVLITQDYFLLPLQHRFFCGRALNLRQKTGII